MSMVVGDRKWMVVGDKKMYSIVALELGSGEGLPIKSVIISNWCTIFFPENNSFYVNIYANMLHIFYIFLYQWQEYTTTEQGQKIYCDIIISKTCNLYTHQTETWILLWRKKSHIIFVHVPSCTNIVLQINLVYGLECSKKKTSVID